MRALYNQMRRQEFDFFAAHAFELLHPGTQFLENWHIRAIAWQLRRVTDGECRRLIITMPPRSLKSIAVSVAWPAFILGHDPTQKILAVSYGEDLAVDLARQCRQLMERNCQRKTEYCI